MITPMWFVRIMIRMFEMPNAYGNFASPYQVVDHYRWHVVVKVDKLAGLVIHERQKPALRSEEAIEP